MSRISERWCKTDAWVRTGGWYLWERMCNLPRVYGAWQRSWRRFIRARQDRLLLSMSFATIERWAVGWWCWSSLLHRRSRWNGLLRYETGRDLFSLGPDRRWAAMAGGMLECLLDRRIHAGQRRLATVEHLPDLVEVGLRVADAVKLIRSDRPDRLVILSPFHYVSQYANVLAIHEVQRALGMANVAIVSGVPHNQYGDDQGLTPGMEILHTHGDGNRNSLGIRLARALMRDKAAVLFADAAPYSMQKYPMDTVEVSVLGRAARIHDGVFRLGRRLDVVLLPYYLTFARGRFGVVVFDPIPLACDDAAQRVADCIGSALEHNYAHNLFAGYPALYGFAPVR
jgi:hypothetical protein